MHQGLCTQTKCNSSSMKGNSAAQTQVNKIFLLNSQKTTQKRNQQHTQYKTGSYFSWRLWSEFMLFLYSLDQNYFHLCKSFFQVTQSGFSLLALMYEKPLFKPCKCSSVTRRTTVTQPINKPDTAQISLLSVCSGVPESSGQSCGNPFKMPDYCNRESLCTLGKGNGLSMSQQRYMT